LAHHCSILRTESHPTVSSKNINPSPAHDLNPIPDRVRRKNVSGFLQTTLSKVPRNYIRARASWSRRGTPDKVLTLLAIYCLKSFVKKDHNRRLCGFGRLGPIETRQSKGEAHRVASDLTSSNLSPPEGAGVDKTEALIKIVRGDGRVQCQPFRASGSSKVDHELEEGSTHALSDRFGSQIERMNMSLDFGLRFGDVDICHTHNSTTEFNHPWAALAHLLLPTLTQRPITPSLHFLLAMIVNTDFSDGTHVSFVHATFIARSCLTNQKLGHRWQAYISRLDVVMITAQGSSYSDQGSPEIRKPSRD
jgi:hypothetical protein